MGSVYLASDTRLPRQWALKEMTDNFTDEAQRAEAEASFQAEAQILAGLNHPNLPRVVDFFREDGRHFLVMDFINGTTLEKRLSQGPLSLAEGLAIGIQISQVLDYLHGQPQPVIFRDLKPGNIILTPDQRPMLVDFGIARIFRQGAGKDTRALGTPGYAAPEQYGRGQSDARTDIYALGATLHHALSGHDPAENPFQFAPLSEFRADLPADLDRVLQRALSLKAEDRFHGAIDFCQALQAVERELSRSGALPKSSKTSELVAAEAPPPTPVVAATPAPAPTVAIPNPTTQGLPVPGFDPPSVSLGKVEWGRQLRTAVVLRGNYKGKLSSDCKWLKVQPAQVNGENVSISLYADARYLDEGGCVAGVIHFKGQPAVAPLRVEVEVRPRRTPVWCWPAAIFLFFFSLVPLAGLITTPLMFGTSWSASRQSQRGLSFLAWTSAFFSLAWVSMVALVVGVLHLDWKALLQHFGF